MGEVHNTHDYLFHITDKTLSAVLYDIGIAHNNCSNLEDIVRTCDMSQAKPVLEFFEQAGLIKKDYCTLSGSGKEVFELSFVYSDEVSARERIAQLLLRNPVVNLISQSFYGRGKIGIEQLRILLNYHGISGQEITYSDVVSLLMLLNRYSIIVYDKKHRAFCVKLAGNYTEPISQYYITPDTPYSNIYNMRKVIRFCRGNIYWIDKHFRKEGFEMLVDGLPYENVKSITIISGTDNITVSAKADYFNLQTELSQRGISLNWRVIKNNSFKWHDRWLIADNQCLNIPPVLAIIRGQRAEIIATKERLDVQPFVTESVLVS